MSSEQFEISRIGGRLESLMKMIPILKELEYDDIHLYYEDSDIWVMEWHNPRHDGATWELWEV